MFSVSICILSKVLAMYRMGNPLIGIAVELVLL